jgi:hypothetical protein
MKNAHFSFLACTYAEIGVVPCLVTPDELMLLKDEETMCFRRGIRPFYARRLDWRRFPLLAKRHSMPIQPIAVPSQEGSRALTTLWEARYPVSFVDPDERYTKN